MIFGTEGDDLLEGMPGADDVIHGGGGDDTLRGGGGSDVLEGGAGADEIDGGEDEGLAEFFGSYRNLVWGDTAKYVDSDAGVTIDLATGTAEGGHAEGDTLTAIESIRASDHADVLVARNEGSSLWGQRGDDSLSGGEGPDYLWGGKGDDTLMGGGGFDFLEGGAGADTLDGGGGGSRDYAGYELSDAGVTIDLAMGTAEGGHAEGDTLTSIESVWGSRYADSITGDAGRNNFVGGAGADTLDGGAGFDITWYVDSDAGVTVNLGTGTGQGGYAEGDTLTGIEMAFGSRHADHLIGGEDSRQLGGWFGNDTLEGGAGNDVLEGGAGADVLDGGGGDWNFAAYWNSDAGVTVNLATGMGQGGHAEGDTLTGISGVRGSSHADHLTGDAGHSNLQGNDGDDTLEGGAGGDWLQGGAGADMIDGGEGDDLARYEGSDAGVAINLARGTGQGGHAEGDALREIENVTGSDHNDRLIGDAGNNRLEGRAGDDILEGRAGDDDLDGGAGSDNVQGGAGDDNLQGGSGGDVLDGGEGYDSADYWPSDAGVTVNLATGTAQGGHAELDALRGIENVLGSNDHADHLTGDARNNYFEGRGGDDTLDGGAGDDDLHGDDGNDHLDGGAGNDQLHGGAGADRLKGGDGGDHLVGDAGADTLDGGEGWDVTGYWGSDAGVTVNLATGTGQGGHAEGDTLAGIDHLEGSGHADHLTGDDEGNVLVGNAGADTLDGGEGWDTAGYWNSDAGVTVNLATGTGQGGHAEGDTLTGIESVSGSDHADHLIGDDVDNRLSGDSGNDTLDGGDGDDWLNGEDGEDLLTGGEGADTFVFGDGDTVTDFEDGSDLIDIQEDFGHINAVNFDTNVTIRQSGDDVEVQIGDAVLTLTGLSAADVSADDFILADIQGSDHADHLIGDDGDNRLNGGGGDDTLEGGAGNDDLQGDDGNDDLHGGDDDDRLRGGAGADRLNGGDGHDDWALYWDSDAGVTVNLATGTGQGGHAEGDTLTGIERIEGSDHADHLTGNDGDNGFGGNAGADTIDGGEGYDFAGYWGSDAGVTVDLATGAGQGGHAEGDTLIGIENIYGSDHADHLTGSDRDDSLSGEAGADTLDGGEGDDNAGYGGSDAGVTVNLATGMGQGGHAEGDTLTGIESVSGSEHADHLIGDNGDNWLDGNAGNDTLEGGAGDDWLDGQDGEDLLTGGEGADTFVFGDGDTVTDFEDGSDLVNIHDMGHINADNFETNVTIRQSGGDVEVEIGGAVLTLTGLSAADVGADDFVLA